MNRAVGARERLGWVTIPRAMLQYVFIAPTRIEEGARPSGRFTVRTFLAPEQNRNVGLRHAEAA